MGMHLTMTTVMTRPMTVSNGAQRPACVTSAVHFVPHALKSFATYPVGSCQRIAVRHNLLSEAAHTERVVPVYGKAAAKPRKHAVPAAQRTQRPGGLRFTGLSVRRDWGRTARRVQASCFT